MKKFLPLLFVMLGMFMMVGCSVAPVRPADTSEVTINEEGGTTQADQGGPIPTYNVDTGEWEIEGDSKKPPTTKHPKNK